MSFLFNLAVSGLSCITWDLSSCAEQAWLLHGMWDLSSQTKDRIRFLTTGPPGKSLSQEDLVTSLALPLRERGPLVHHFLAS